ncbi:MAG: LPS export ABC transporter permease LptF [Nevskiales bacterium]
MRAGLGILERYLLREAMFSWLAVSVVLLLLMVGSGFARFLGVAAAGKLPPDMVLRLVGLSSIEYAVIIIPFSLLIAITLALGRLYRDNEMTAMGTGGMGLKRIYRPFFLLALVAAGLTAWLSLELSPWASGRVNRIRSVGRAEAVDLRVLEPGQFRSILSGRGVFYTQDYAPEDGSFRQVFVRAEDGEGNTVVIVADRGVQQVDEQTRERLLVLQEGYRYEGEAGRADYRITAFREHGVRINPPDVSVRQRSSAKTLDELIKSAERTDAVELHWRLSAPVTVLMLALMAVPLAHARPREGRYGRLVLAMVAYLVYSNLLVGARLWTDRTPDLPSGTGIWLVHAAMLVFVLWTIVQRESGFGRIRARAR